MTISDMNLIWIDLEMTGLDPDRDTILEIATIVTDSQLNVLEDQYWRSISLTLLSTAWMNGTRCIMAGAV